MSYSGCFSGGPETMEAAGLLEAPRAEGVCDGAHACRSPESARQGSMDVSLSELRELVLDRRPGVLLFMESQRVRYD